MMTLDGMSRQGHNMVNSWGENDGCRVLFEANSRTQTTALRPPMCISGPRCLAFTRCILRFQNVPYSSPSDVQLGSSQGLLLYYPTSLDIYGLCCIFSLPAILALRSKRRYSLHILPVLTAGDHAWSPVSRALDGTELSLANELA